LLSPIVDRLYPPKLEESPPQFITLRNFISKIKVSEGKPIDQPELQINDPNRNMYRIFYKEPAKSLSDIKEIKDFRRTVIFSNYLT
jgi:hypothetical protein